MKILFPWLNDNYLFQTRGKADRRKRYLKNDDMTEIPDQKKSLGTLKKLAGRFLIDTDIMESEVVSAYRKQWQSERPFRTIKRFIENRPVYHRKSGHIRAHVFVCVLSLLFSVSWKNLLVKQERAVYFIGEQGSFRYSEKSWTTISQNP